MSENKPLFNAEEAEQYFTDLSIYYKNIANEVFKQDNKEKRAPSFIYSAEYMKLFGMYLAIQEVLEYFEKFDLQQGCEDPLTLDQMREIIGEPVYDGLGYDWYIIEDVTEDEVIMTDGVCFDIDEDSTNTVIGRFYRNKPKEG